MASDTDAGGLNLSPEDQSFILLGPSGQGNITLPLIAVDQLWESAASAAINYGSQIGASFIMLVVLLAMTPKSRFRRAPTIIHTAALAINLIRMILLSLFFPSTWFELYTVMTGDLQFVATADYNISVAASAFSIPITILVEMALIVQAWSMLQLWPRWQKVIATVISIILVVTTISFSFAITSLQILFILYNDFRAVSEQWIRITYLGLTTASITWFCFLFNCRLILHMWTNRSILPSLKGLKAMDVLVITNGILMLIPVIFAGLEFGTFLNFESASLTQTSVIVVLPLGTLVAQRLANPTWFNATPVSLNNSAEGSASKGRLLFSGTTNNGTTTGARNIGFHHPHIRNGLMSHISSEAHSVSTASSPDKPRFHHSDHVGAELARIDAGEVDLERGGVRVNHSIERSVEKIPTKES
ncbi:fungal pheromone mating factor STE2 GPCR-domain-containing protein [Lasiosphaeria hispida]|uniref:Fungal pheromone mating factor STE2 GPCR-domain-containing protein n=1 Tax=Lasiosphaeria hispida TaxID=260671 RepID=A0AAJ0HEK7_9PEZI|nr:fungal pheromone mating factor STE2 GPCR-domain-containing protein [Lasiosphaeria hispida]